MEIDSEGIERLLRAMENIGVHLKYLGTGDAASTMGAIEFLAKEVKDAGDNIAGAIRELADAVKER